MDKKTHMELKTRLVAGETTSSGNTYISQEFPNFHMKYMYIVHWHTFICAPRKLFHPKGFSLLHSHTVPIILRWMHNCLKSWLSLHPKSEYKTFFRYATPNLLSNAPHSPNITFPLFRILISNMWNAFTPTRPSAHLSLLDLTLLLMNRRG